MVRRILRPVIAGSLALLVGACSSTPQSATMWVREASPTIRFQPGMAPQAAPTSIHLSGAGRETASFRFSIAVPMSGIQGAELSVTNLASENQNAIESAITVSRLHSVGLDRFPGWHVRTVSPDQRDKNPLDVLVPLHAPRGGWPSRLEPGITYSFWVDIAIPPDAYAGHYRAEIALNSPEGRLARIDVRLEVLPFSLPELSDVAVIGEVDHEALFRHHVRVAGGPAMLGTQDWSDSPRRGQLDRLLENTMHTLHDHRVTPVLPKVAPRVTIGARRQVKVDWNHYDRVVSGYLDGRAFSDRRPVRYWPMPFHSILSPQRTRSSRFSSTHTPLLSAYFSEAAKHFAEKGWFDRAYAMLPPKSSATHPHDWTSWPGWSATRDFAAAARSADQRIPVLTRLWPQSMEPFGWVGYADTAFSGGGRESSLDVDIWMPPGQFYDPDAMALERARGRRTWMSVDRPPFSGSLSIYAPAGWARILTWQANQLGVETLFLGSINNWPDASQSSTPQDCIKSDPNVLLYPGTPFGLDTPVVSVRLKELRRSMEDAAYRTMLLAGGMEALAATVRRSLSAYAGTDAYRAHFADGRRVGWVEDPLLFDLARRIMVKAWIDTLGGRRPLGRMEAFANDATWRRFMLASRQVRLSTVGTRMHLTGSRESWEADIDYTMSISNRKRVPIDGLARMADLPGGWTPVETNTRVNTVAPNTTSQLNLTLRATTPPLPRSTMAWASSASRLPMVELRTERGDTYRTPARVSFASATRIQTVIPGIADAPVSSTAPIRIDGDLSDWPPGSTNVLSGFQLIAESPGTVAVDAGRMPQRSTIAFATRDDRFLYVAINAEGDPAKLSHGTSDRRNRIEFEDLVPVGGELVQVLIDPLNSGTRSPGDLYHIAVKPSGTYLAEKGIRFNPPCGPSQPWPVELDVATARVPGRWTVELRVPLDAFDAVATEHTIWGFNVTRLDAENQEFSTWSGATGNAYDPISLGNLYLP
jgi:hypothetical protein